MQAQSKPRRSKLHFFLLAKFWIILGVLLILTGFVLAHLSNAHLIQWRNGSEETAHIIFHVIGPIILLLGIIKFFIEKKRN